VKTIQADEARADEWDEDEGSGTRMRAWAHEWNQDGASPVPTIYDAWSQWGKQWVIIY